MVLSAASWSGCRADKAWTSRVPPVEDFCRSITPSRSQLTTSLVSGSKRGSFPASIYLIKVGPKLYIPLSSKNGRSGSSACPPKRFSTHSMSVAL